MPKIRSRKGAAKRVKFTAGGKIRIKRANSRHILTTKSPKRKRHLRKGAYVSSFERDKIFKILPYG